MSDADTGELEERQKKLEEHEQELRNILNRDYPEQSKIHRKNDLKGLATKVGASTQSRRGGEASEPELVDNINDALRREAKIITSQTASRHLMISKETVREAKKSARSAWIGALAAWIGALATLAALLYNIYLRSKS